MISLAFGYVCDVCVSDVRRACCVPLYFGIVVENRMETLHATDVVNVARRKWPRPCWLTVCALCVNSEFARIRVRVWRMRLGCWTCHLCEFALRNCS